MEFIDVNCHVSCSVFMLIHFQLSKICILEYLISAWSEHVLTLDNYVFGYLIIMTNQMYIQEDTFSTNFPNIWVHMWSYVSINLVLIDWILRSEHIYCTIEPLCDSALYVFARFCVHIEVANWRNWIHFYGHACRISNAS